MSSALIVAGLLAITASAIILLGVAAGLDRASPHARHRAAPEVGPLTADNDRGDDDRTRAGAPEPAAGPLEGHHDG